jgi:hypothetical protein
VLFARAPITSLSWNSSSSHFQLWLAEKNKWTSPQLKKAQAVRGKLNVPRERFQQISPTHFVWAGK